MGSVSSSQFGAFFKGSFGSWIADIGWGAMAMIPGMQGIAIPNLIATTAAGIGQGVMAVQAQNQQGAANRTAQESAQLLAEAKSAQLRDMLNGNQGPAATAKAVKMVQAIQQGNGAVTAGMAGQMAGLGPANSIGLLATQRAVSKTVGKGYGGAADAATHFGNPIQMTRRTWLPIMGKQGSTYAGNVISATQQNQAYLNRAAAAAAPTGTKAYVPVQSGAVAGQQQASTSYSAAAYSGQLTANPRGEMTSVGGAS